MTEQQNHLQSALSQQREIAQKINSLNNELVVERERFAKLQGIIEYLINIGVKLTSEEDSDIPNNENKFVSESQPE